MPAPRLFVVSLLTLCVVAFRPGTIRPVSADDGAPRFASYLGGDGADFPSAAPLLDDDGNVYVVGMTDSRDFPGTDAVRRTPKAKKYFFVTKTAADGSEIYSIRFGAKGEVDGRAVGLDAAGNLLIAGATAASGFPTTTGAAQRSRRGASDLVAAKIGPTGEVLYSTYFGGSLDEQLRRAQVDSAGNLLLIGTTSSSDFPTRHAYQKRFGNTSGGDVSDAFVTKLDPSGEVVYSTFVGGRGTDELVETAVSDDGDVMLAGSVENGNIRTVNAIAPKPLGAFDGVVVRLDPTGRARFATYLGGSGGDGVMSLAVDREGRAVILCTTTSVDFPLSSSIRPADGHPGLAVVKLEADGAIRYSTFLSGLSSVRMPRFLVDDAGAAYVCGTVAGDADALRFPTTAAFDATADPTNDEVFAAKFDATGDCAFATWLGGSSSDVMIAAALDRSGGLILSGNTSSADFPVRGSWSPGSGGGPSAFVTRLGADGDAVFSLRTDVGTTLVAAADSTVYAIGVARSLGAATLRPAFPTPTTSSYDMYVMAFAPSGEVSFATYLGGSDDDGPSVQVAALASGDLVVCGGTASSDFPTVSPSQPSYGGAGDAFVTIFRPDGTVRTSSYFGGSGQELAPALVARGSRAALVGVTSSPDLPTVHGVQTTFGGGLWDTFVLGLDD